MTPRQGFIAACIEIVELDEDLTRRIKCIPGNFKEAGIYRQRI